MTSWIYSPFEHRLTGEACCCRCIQSRCRHVQLLWNVYARSDCWLFVVYIVRVGVYMYVDTVVALPDVLGDHRLFFVMQEMVLQLSLVTANRPTLHTVVQRPLSVCRRVHVDRHSTTAGSTLVFGCYNIRSVANKLDDLLEVRRDLSIDVLFLVET